MSSKSAPEPAARTARPSWSLAARLTAWYAGSAFALILAATGFLYWALSNSLDREDDHLLADQVRVLRAVLVGHPADWQAVRQEAEEEFENRLHTQVYVRILDGEGRRVLIETPGMERLLPPSAFPDPVPEPGEGVDLPAVNGGLFRGLAVRLDAALEGHSTCVVQVAMDRSGELELLARYRKNLWLVLGAALLVCAVVGYRIARRGLRPLHAVRDTAQRIHAANLGERIAVDGLPSELLTLADTFNRMLDRLEQSFARLSRFSADIAHELRTPVNNLRGELEVALGKARAPEEYRDVLGSSLEECGRLARLIDSLLFLARAEDPKTEVQREPLEIGRELATVCDFYEAMAADKGVKLIVAADRPLHADLSRPLFQRAVGNLLVNAVAHTPPGGAVTLTAFGDDVSATVTVADTGCGIAAAHLPHVFDRFYRADPVRSSSTGNVGLGLAIVKSIVEMHGGSVHIASEVGRGTRVSLSFPRKMTKP
jgi:two-component system heavy metal sensor histidine kinase CusS